MTNYGTPDYEEFSKEDRESVANLAVEETMLTHNFHNLQICNESITRIRTHQKCGTKADGSSLNYFFISFIYTDEEGAPKWIRQSMLEEGDLLRYLLYIELLKRNGSVSNLRIFNESSLDETISVTDDNGETEEITRRHYHFGLNYQSAHDLVAEEIRKEEESDSVVTA